MTKADDEMSSFIDWVRGNMEELRHEPSEQVAEELGEALLSVNDQLGVEVDDGDGSFREVILTAFSEPKLFPLVKRISEDLSDVPGWRFVALKPPRGFSFEISVGKFQIEVDTFEFAPLPDIDGGIELFAPMAVLDILSEKEAEELAWLIVETGIGEELTGLLQHIEFSRAKSDGRRPITELEEYVRAELMRLH